MENKDTFKMTYSAQQQQELERIRAKYIPREPDKMRQLRALDASAGHKAAARAISVGVVGALLLGVGMSLIMSDFGLWVGAAALPLGLVCGVAGLILVGCAYPIHRRALARERAKIAPEILRLTDELSR